MTLSDKIKDNIEDMTLREASSILGISHTTLRLILKKSKTNLDKNTREAIMKFCLNVEIDDFTPVKKRGVKKKSTKVNIDHLLKKYKTKLTKADELREQFGLSR